MESDCEKNGMVGLSPNTVLPLNQKKRIPRPRPSSRKDEILVLKGEFREISFSRYHRSVSCKTVAPSRGSRRECSSEIRRGSIYQSSGEVSRMREMGASEERRKIEVSRGNKGGENPPLSIFDSLRGSSSEETLIKRRPAEPMTGGTGPGFFEICLDPSSRGKNNASETTAAETGARMGRPLSSGGGNELLPERDCSSKPEPVKTRFGPIRKMFDPFTKSKSLRSPIKPPGGPTEMCESLASRSAKKKNEPSSPVHLRGNLKLEMKHGFPFFEFSSQSPEEEDCVFVAKTWKAKDAFNWVYTFHSSNDVKKSSASRLDEKDSSMMIGQMQVSSRISSELRDGTFDSSMVTEFVLHDIAHARLSTSNQENSLSKTGNARFRGKFEPEPSNSHPWAAECLDPSLEIAAIAMRAPFERRESLKHKRADDGLLGLTTAGPAKPNPYEVDVVIPAGNHGLAGPESGTTARPSSLLDRWRSGGGCDCGGWDMACPITVLANPHLRRSENRMPMELFVQGSKDETRALTMTAIEEGVFAVDFHARLSTLQAFSICVAILHGSETSSELSEERDRKLVPQRNSLKTMIEEEVKFLIEAVTAEKKNLTTTKRVKEIPPSYVINPPFSPIARV